MTEPRRFAGKRALVTGGSRGIGAAIARRLAAEGAAVAVNYVANEASANALVDDLRTNGTEASAFRADVSDPRQTRDLVQRVAESWRAGHLGQQRWSRTLRRTRGHHAS